MPIRFVSHIDAETRDRVVIRLCQVRSLSLLELTWLPGRNKAYVRTILKAFIVSERLEYIYPAKPRHPHQCYKAKNT